MKIATIVRGYIPTPRPTDMIYAPIDLAEIISRQLAKLGHDVTYFGPNGTHIAGVNIETCNMRPLIHNAREMYEFVQKPDLLLHYVPSSWDGIMVRDMFERARQGEFD